MGLLVFALTFLIVIVIFLGVWMTIGGDNKQEVVRRRMEAVRKAERREHVETALKVVSLADRMDHYPRQLSGGQEQRVAIARAIVTDPTIVVADEPTGDLDAKSAEEILNLLTELNRQFHKTIVMVTHDPRAERYVDTVYRLDKGILAGIEPGKAAAQPAAAGASA